MERHLLPKWALRPCYKSIRCRLCGEEITRDEEYEAVKSNGSEVITYYHCSCLKAERGQRRE